MGFLVVSHSQHFPSIATTAKTIGYLPQLDSKTMLLKIPHTYIIEHEEIELVFNGKHYLYWLVFIMWEVLHMIPMEKCVYQSHQAMNHSVMIYYGKNTLHPNSLEIFLNFASRVNK